MSNFLKNKKCFLTKNKISVIFGKKYYPKTNDIEKETKELENKVKELLKKVRK